MSQLLAITNDARQTFTTIVGSQKIRLNIFYLEDQTEQLNNGWYCDLILITDTEEIITQGERLVSSVPISFNVPSDFTGYLIPIPITSPGQNLISIYAWDVTHQLVYFTQDEIDDNII